MTNELKIKSRHKKSLSDNFNVSHEQMQEEQKKYYEMFSNLKDPWLLPNLSDSFLRFSVFFSNLNE